MNKKKEKKQVNLSLESKEETKERKIKEKERKHAFREHTKGNSTLSRLH